MLRHRDEVGEMCHVVGDDRGRAKHCFFFMAVKDVRNEDPRRSHALLFLVDSAVIEYKIHSFGHDVVFVVRA